MSDRATVRRADEMHRDELAVLVREMLLAGQLIDRAGMPHLIADYGRDEMGRIAIDEWMGASPIYTRRMQRMLGFSGETIETMFKGLQLDIGAPPEFMDFRLKVIDDHHGEFWLDHCGALMDVEPMGDDYVRTMCHDIEDPTFDATAIATNRRARIRPIHRPPRVPSDRNPHCAWTVTIEPDRPELPLPTQAEYMFTTAAASVELSPIDPDDSSGAGDYRGPLVHDIAFGEFSHSALVRIDEELALQHQLIALGFLASVRQYAESEDQAIEIFRKQLTGIAGLTAERLKAALGLSSDPQGWAEVLALHPILGPGQYTGVAVRIDGDPESVGDVVLHLPAASSAVSDGGWLSIITPEHVEPIQAMATALDPQLVATGRAVADGVEVRLTRGTEALRESGEVAITRFSSGSNFEFADRGPSIPITPV